MPITFSENVGATAQIKYVTPSKTHDAVESGLQIAPRLNQCPSNGPDMSPIPPVRH